MKKKRILSLLMTVALAMMLCVTAFAQSSVTGPDDKPLPDTTDGYDYAFGLTKYMIVNSDATIPTEEFKFNITAGAAVTGTGADTSGVNTNATKGPVLAGILPDVTQVKIPFTMSSSTTPGAAGDGIVNSTAKKYATGKAYFDFSNVDYPKPGIYRYTIAEEAGATPGITYDTNSYTLDVVVGYAAEDNGKLVGGAVDKSGPNGIPDAEETGTMSILNYFYYKNNDAGAPTGAKVDPGNVTFPNTMASESLTVSKKVTGTLGDKEKYFAFSVKVSGTAQYTYTVDITHASATADFDGNGTIAGTEVNPTSITIPTGGTEKEETFYLKDGQYIIINGLPIATEYTVSEVNYSADGYITKLSQNGEDKGEVRTTADGSKIIEGAENSADFTNIKNETPLTGIIMQVLPFAVIVLLAAGGFVLMMVSKKKKLQR